MRYKIGCLSFVLLQSVLCGICVAQSVLRVDESATRIELTNNGSAVLLAVQNPSQKSVPTHVELQYVSPWGSAVATEHRELVVKSGKSRERIEMPQIFAQAANDGIRDFLWYRLRYTLTPAADNTEATTGIMSVGAAIQGIFDLQVTAPEFVSAGETCLVRVRAVRPVTHDPVAGVALTLKINPDDSDVDAPKSVTGVTDHHGLAKLQFTLPGELDDDVDIEVDGTVGDYSTSATGSLSKANWQQVTISTDKPFYQPGQMMNARVMAFGTDHKALAGQAFDLIVQDPTDSPVYRARVTTSKFGIASASWLIPDNLKLGTYEVRLNSGEDDENRFAAAANIKISRYELPTFTVTAKRDRVFYLPGQNANVEVRADYLYGEPVRAGHVRIVHEGKREWNYRAQTWDIDEDEVYEGDTDSTGKYAAQIDLTIDHNALAESDYERFDDLHYAAYFTDKSTGRTEQRRFDVRITKDQIHVYVVRPAENRSSKTGMDFYISADYADGRPAQCEIEIHHVIGHDTNLGPRIASREEIVGKVRTNRYGVAKINGVSWPGIADERDIELDFHAGDRIGNTGRHAESFYDYSRDESWLSLETDKTIYAPGEPIRAQIRSSDAREIVIVEASQNGQVVATKEETLAGRRADVEFDWNEKFHGAVNLMAYAFTDGQREWSGPSEGAIASRSVLFPKDEELKVDVHMAKASYKPGEQAEANIHVSSPEGMGAASAVGLVVVDKAVEERERTEEDFGSNWGFYSFLESWRSSEAIGGVSFADLKKLDMSKPVPDGLDLVAEMLLLEVNAIPPEAFGSGDSRDPATIFSSEISADLQSLRNALDNARSRDQEVPLSIADVNSVLAKRGLKFESYKDPWGTNFRAQLEIDRGDSVLNILSAGPDKKFGTGDDFTAAIIRMPYFLPHAEEIEKALNAYHDRTGAYIRDEAMLAGELARQNLDMNSWRDPWGSAYRFEFGISGRQYTVTVTSAGPDKKFNSPESFSADDFTLTVKGRDYFAETESKIQSALQKHFLKTNDFPKDLAGFKQALAGSGIDPGTLLDGWGKPVYVMFSETSAYSDNVVVESYNEIASQPLTARIRRIYIRSAGPDRVEGTNDDFNLATFSQTVFVQSARDTVPQAVPGIALLGSSGAVTGTVFDPQKAVIVGTSVTATNNETGTQYSAQVNDQGEYILQNLPPGMYTLQFDKPGFKITRITAVPVRSSAITHVSAVLNVGEASMTVEVTATGTALQTSNATMVSRKLNITATLGAQAATPRLREYFPETLVWKPEIVTDKKGRATLEFPLADNITTWKLSAVASTINGEIGVADKEIRAFQPFFVEHDPPRFLTVGDEVSLPVVLRNYLEKPLDVSVTMKSADWFKALSVTSMKSNLAPGNFVSDVFRFSATEPVRDAKQQVDAIATDTSDAIAKPVTVRPNGEEKNESRSGLLTGATSFDFAIPAAAMQSTVDARLKIYPNLEAHVLESIEEIMERPYGCAEQTISSTYPSLLFLRYAKQVGREDSPIAQRAHRYLERGYERLLGYRNEDGGITYWGRGESDTALTAYALRFFTDASEFISVDDDVRAQALSWLVKHADAEGKWPITQLWGNHAFDEARTEMVTAYVARVLAETKLSSAGDENARLNKTAEAAVRKALVYLAPKIGHTDDPYGMASYALAAIAIGEKAEATPVIARLRALEHREADTSYWLLEMNTPFYGWGRAGRVETTSLVLRALAAAGDASDSDMESRGLLFLLKEQDRYGEWYSTQATILALDTIASVGAQSSTASVATKAEVFVDGVSAGVITLPPGSEIAMPVETNLSRFLASGAHRVEVKQASGAARASYQMVANYYIPWSNANIGSDLHHESSSNEAVRLAVNYDKQDAAIGDVVRCSVDAERIGFRGYGMMLAEIGLPPGAEVDRASLERAMRDSGWQINQYDVLPDRVIVYLWPYAGGTKFTFDFKERYGVNALTTASTLYDYYNPDARAVVQPVRFTVK